MNDSADSTLVFPCQRCGLCCQHVHLAAETQFLNRGDGTCRYYEAASRLCSIYAERPDICRVDLQYMKKYALLYAWDEYVALNLLVCANLQEQVLGITVTELR
jgi:Fe-S-cluster containining protein